MSAISGAQSRLHATSVRLTPRRAAAAPAGMPRSAHGRISAATTSAIRDGEPVVVRTNHGSASAVICEPVAEMTSAATSAASGGRRSTLGLSPRRAPTSFLCRRQLVRRVAGPAEDLLDDRPEELEWQRVVVRVEAVLVEVLAELDAVGVERMVEVLVARVAVLAHQVRVVVGLEQRVLLDDPADALAHERPQHGADHLAVRDGRERVADVVEERRRDVLLVLAGSVGARG